MFDTKTTWKDSGYDCDHCGGEVLKRTARQAGQPEQISYQCRLCGCQWSSDGDLLRVGTKQRCRLAWRQSRGEVTSRQWHERYVWLIILLPALALLWLGSADNVQWVFVLSLVAAILAPLFQYGRQREWW